MLYGFTPVSAPGLLRESAEFMRGARWNYCLPCIGPRRGAASAFSFKFLNQVALRRLGWPVSRVFFCQVGAKKSNQPGAITADHRYVGAGALRTPFLQLSPAPRGNPPFLNKEFCFDIVGPHSCTAQCTAVSDLEGSNTHSEWPIPKKSILQYSIRPNAVKVTYSGSFFDMSITQCFRVPTKVVP